MNRAEAVGHGGERRKPRGEDHEIVRAGALEVAEDPGLAPAVVDLLRRNDFIDQVVITSLDGAAITQIKSIEPHLKAGLIVTASAGDVSRTNADFVSLNAAKATILLIRRAHRSGSAQVCAVARGLSGLGRPVAARNARLSA